MRRIAYFIQVARQNIRRNILLNIVAILTISMALLIMSGFLLLYTNLQQGIEQATRNLTISVYLKDNLSPDALDQLKTALTDLEGVTAVRFVSKKDALEDMRKRLGNDADILDGLDQNPLPASFEVGLDSADTGRQADDIADKIKSMKGVADIFYAWEWAFKLHSFLRFIRISAWVIGGLLFLTVVFIVANTIKLTIMARSDELYIMRLMGATASFVRMPYLIEGMFQGLCGGPLALILLYIGYLVMSTFVSLPLGFSLANLAFLPASICILVVAAGVLLGFLGSLTSLGRFLKT